MDPTKPVTPVRLTWIVSYCQPFESYLLVR